MGSREHLYVHYQAGTAQLLTMMQQQEITREQYRMALEQQASQQEILMQLIIISMNRTEKRDGPPYIERRWTPRAEEKLGELADRNSLNPLYRSWEMERTLIFFS